MTKLSIHPAYPTHRRLRDGIAAARVALADHDTALALLADGLDRGALSEAEAAQMLAELGLVPRP